MGANASAPTKEVAILQRCLSQTFCIVRLRRVFDKCVPELVHKVEAGAVAVSAAGEVAKLPADAQRQVSALPDGDIKGAAKVIKTAPEIVHEPSPKLTGRRFRAGTPWRRR